MDTFVPMEEVMMEEKNPVVIPLGKSKENGLTCLVCNEVSYTDSDSLVAHIQARHQETAPVVKKWARSYEPFPNNVKQRKAAQIDSGESKFKNALI